VFKKIDQDIRHFFGYSCKKFRVQFVNFTGDMNYVMFTERVCFVTDVVRKKREEKSKQFKISTEEKTLYF